MALKNFEITKVKIKVKKKNLEVWQPSNDDDAIEVEIPNYDADFLPGALYFLRKCQTIIDNAISGETERLYPDLSK